MTSPINGQLSTEFDVKKTATSIYTNKTTTDAAKSKELGDQDTFMKLLVAQLKYQDPSKPTDSAALMAQTAQYTQVEKLGQLVDMMSAQQLIGASALVGRTVTYQTADGSTQSGVVKMAKLNGGSEPTLVVGNMDVQLSKVTEVQQTAPLTGPASVPATVPATVPASAPAAVAPATVPDSVPASPVKD
jgi:flagellar basal-body rod modification protein FlgD